MSKQVRETNAGKAISAWVILDRKRQHVATVQAHYGNSGTVMVDVWHTNGAPVQQATAGGYGYDKLTAALSGMTIDGHKMNDHCGESKRLPRGQYVWPANAKAQRGYQFANYCMVHPGNGQPLDSYHWRELALAQWRADTGAASDAWPESDSVWRTIATQLRDEAETRGEAISGYASYYRISGLAYLTAIGYHVLQAI